MPNIDGYWYAPIVARPVPELPDVVTVGLAFGNGTLQHLEFDEKLSRLKGMVSPDHRAVLAVALQVAAGNLRDMESLNTLRSALGVQFSVGEPYPLLQPYTKRTILALRRAHFDVLESARDRMDGLQRESLRALDREVNEILPAGLEYLRKRVPFSELYPGVAERYATAQIPPVHRMVRSTERDLVLSSVIVRMEDRAHLDQIVQRTVRQFYFLRRLHAALRERSRIEVRSVGVIQPLESSATNETRLLHELIAEQWQQHADEVIVLNSRAEASEKLSPEMRWAAEGNRQVEF